MGSRVQGVQEFKEIPAQGWNEDSTIILLIPLGKLSQPLSQGNLGSEAKVAFEGGGIGISSLFILRYLSVPLPNSHF